MEEIIRKIVSQIKQKTDIKPEIAIVLGSGLSDILGDMTDKIVINYSELEGMQNKRRGAQKSIYNRQDKWCWYYCHAWKISLV